MWKARPAASNCFLNTIPSLSVPAMSKMPNASPNIVILVMTCVCSIFVVECVPLSPCPRVFHYEYDGRHWNGVVKIHSHVYNRYRGERMSVQLTVSMPSGRVASRGAFIGGGADKLELYSSMESTFTQILANRAIVYRVTFADQAISPTLVKIDINNTRICTNPHDIDYDAMGAFRRYRLEASLVLPTAQAPSSADVDKKLLHRPLVTPLALNPHDGIGSNIRWRQQTEKVCGSIDPRQWSASQSPTVDGRQRIPKGSWPWLVAIYLKKPQGVTFQCTGSLISNKLILTAAHCFWLGTQRQPRDILLVMGRHNLRDWNEADSVMCDAKSIYLHPDFLRDGHRFDADLAIVRPSEPFEYTAWIRPVCLWAHAQPADTAGEMATFVGWQQLGSDFETEILPRLMRLPIVSRAECIRARTAFSYITSNRTFCGGRRNGQGPCRGDAGGALALQRNGVWFLRGIFSVALVNSAMHTCDLNNFVVFTDVPKFTAWINEFL